MVTGTRRLYEAMAAEPRVSATVIQTVGRKGYDGLAIALVTRSPGDDDAGMANYSATSAFSLASRSSPVS